MLLRNGQGKPVMAKRALKLTFRIPPYRHPRISWRRMIHAEALKLKDDKGIDYMKKDRLEVQCSLYMNTKSFPLHDVDNRLKDILDALQGRAGGSKRVRTLAAIVPNDNQVYRVVFEKLPSPPGMDGGGIVTIRRLPSANIRWRRARRARGGNWCDVK